MTFPLIKLSVSFPSELLLLLHFSLLQLPHSAQVESCAELEQMFEGQAEDGTGVFRFLLFLCMCACEQT